MTVLRYEFLNKAHLKKVLEARKKIDSLANMERKPHAPQNGKQQNMK